MSGAADNSLKHWLFDSADGTARLLRFRSGHSAPPSCLKFYGSGNKLLSAGKPSRLCLQFKALGIQPGSLTGWRGTCSIQNSKVGLTERTHLVQNARDSACSAFVRCGIASVNGWVQGRIGHSGCSA